MHSNFMHSYLAIDSRVRPQCNYLTLYTSMQLFNAFTYVILFIYSMTCSSYIGIYQHHPYTNIIHIHTNINMMYLKNFAREDRSKNQCYIRHIAPKTCLECYVTTRGVPIEIFKLILYIPI